MDAPEPAPREEATLALRAMAAGHAGASEALLALLYEDLRDQAGAYLRRERADHTLQPTALVHEAWMRLIDHTRVEWQNRDHFLAVAAMAMRRVLVNHHAAKNRVKRGGDWKRVELEAGAQAVLDERIDLVELDGALERLRELSEPQARIVELRFFGGLPMEDAARVLGVSLATAERHWYAARAWLAGELGS